MSDWYELIGQTVVKIEGDIIECALRFEQVEKRVALTKVLGMVQVSTVFLGLDYSFRGGRPILFETMVFRPGEGGYECERCSTWAEAEAQHARICAEVARPAVMLAYLGRLLRDWWQRAHGDLSRRWWDLQGVELTETELAFQDIEARLDRWEW